MIFELKYHWRRIDTNWTYGGRTSPWSSTTWVNVWRFWVGGKEQTLCWRK